MDPVFVTQVERALEAHGRLIAANKREISEGLNATAGNMLDLSRSSAAMNRVVLALMARHVARAEDPLRELETLRSLAQDPLGTDLPEVVDQLERIFAKVQASVIDPHPDRT